MLGDTVWLTVRDPVHPKGAGRDWAQDRPVNFLLTKLRKPFLNGLGFVHRGTVMLKQGQARTVNTKLEAHII